MEFPKSPLMLLFINIPVTSITQHFCFNSKNNFNNEFILFKIVIFKIKHIIL